MSPAVTTHGRTGYRYGCRCDVCRTDANKARRERGYAPSASVTHGLASTYAHGCRCDLCRKAEAEYMADYRDRKRAESPIVEREINRQTSLALRKIAARLIEQANALDGIDAPTGDELRTCARCHKTKPLREFARRSNGARTCLACYSEIRSVSRRNTEERKRQERLA